MERREGNRKGDREEREVGGGEEEEEEEERIEGEQTNNEVFEFD